MYRQERLSDTYSLSEKSVCLVFIGLLTVGALGPATPNALFKGPADEGFTCIPSTVLYNQSVRDGHQ